MFTYFIKNDQNYGPTTLGFCITIMHRLTLHSFFVKNSTHIVPQPLYSPDLCDFWLLPKLKRLLQGTRFESIDEIKAESKKALMAIPEKHYLACFKDWKIRWYKCISSRVDYFEWDKISFYKQIHLFAHSSKYFRTSVVYCGVRGRALASVRGFELQCGGRLSSLSC